MQCAALYNSSFELVIRLVKSKKKDIKKGRPKKVVNEFWMAIGFRFDQTIKRVCSNLQTNGKKEKTIVSRTS